MRSEKDIEKQLKLHPLQYGFISRDEIVYNTENDEYAKSAFSYRPPERIRERYNRCPNCEQWSPCDKRKELLAELAAIKDAQEKAIDEIAQLSQDMGLYD